MITVMAPDGTVAQTEQMANHITSLGWMLMRSIAKVLENGHVHRARPTELQQIQPE